MVFFLNEQTVKLCDCGGDKNTERAHTGKLVIKKPNEDIMKITNLLFF